jgi:hypothetical protein
MANRFFSGGGSTSAPSGGSGFTYFQETTPVSANNGETWYNPTTKAERTYNNGTWEHKVLDGQYF